MIGGIGAFVFAAAMAALLFIPNLPPAVSTWITPAWILALLIALVGLAFSGRAGSKRASLAVLLVIAGVAVFIAGLYLNNQTITGLLRPNPLTAFEEHLTWVLIMYALMVVFLLALAMMSLTMIAQIFAGDVMWCIAGLVMLVWGLGGAAALVLQVAAAQTGDGDLGLLGLRIQGYALYVQIGAWVLTGLALFTNRRG